ncbi:MAG: DUF2141 domain-containing protein [Opitutaceae bacterium]|nr:DUF2141 domain-containing protein [Opitutaceae bacterium]
MNIHRLLLLLPLSAGLPLAAADLDVVLTGFRHTDGQVLVGVATAAASFPSSPQFNTTAVIDASTRTAKAHFTGLPAGAVAVSVIHDRNRDGKLGTNFLGIPTEPVGASNNAKGRMGPPAFADAQIELRDGTNEVRIVMGAAK